MHINYNVMVKRRSKSATVVEVELPATGGSVAVRGGDIAVLGGTTTLRWGSTSSDVVSVSPGSGVNSVSGVVVSSTANTWGVPRVMDIYFECTLFSGLYATLRLRQGEGASSGGEEGGGEVPGEDIDSDFYWVSLQDPTLLFDGETPEEHTFDGVSPTDIFVQCRGAVLVHTHWHVDGASGSGTLTVVSTSPLESTDKVVLGLGFAVSTSALGSYTVPSGSQIGRSFCSTSSLYSHTDESILSGWVSIADLVSGHTFSSADLSGALPFADISSGDVLCWLGASYGPSPVDVVLGMRDVSFAATYPIIGGVVSFDKNASLSSVSSQYISGPWVCGPFSSNYMVRQDCDYSKVPSSINITSTPGADSVDISWKTCCSAAGISPPQAVWHYRWGGSLPAKYPLLQLRLVEPIPLWISSSFADITQHQYASVDEIQSLFGFPYDAAGESPVNGYGASYVSFSDRNLAGADRVWSVEVVDLFTQQLVTTLRIRQSSAE